MSVFSYHLANISIFQGIKNNFINPLRNDVEGLIHSEYMNSMKLGSPIISISRFMINELALFVQWEDEESLDNFMNHHDFGKLLSQGWYVKMAYLRKWGKFEGFELPIVSDKLASSDSPVVAVTIARMKPLAIPRFLYWGRPVEKLVRDHPGTKLSLASIRFPNVVSTFSIWRNEKEMTDMVHGHSQVEKPKRHSKAMMERNRKSFHFEFTTLRFKPISEFGIWKGESGFTL